MSLQATTSQTVGPYFSIGLAWLNQDNLVGPGISGERVTIEGRVLDGDGQPVPDAIIEVWQATHTGSMPTRKTRGINPSNQGSGASGGFPPITMGNSALRPSSQVRCRAQMVARRHRTLWCPCSHAVWSDAS